MRKKRVWQKIAEPVARGVLRAYFTLAHRVRTAGLENLPKDPGPLIIVSNHGSYFDGPLLWAFLPLNFTILISRRIARHRLLRPLVAGGYAVEVETLNSFSLKNVLLLAASGQPLLIFPEGRRSTTGGLMKIYEGAGFLAYKSSAVVLPVYIKNTYRIATSLKPGRKEYFAPLTISIGKPQPPLDLGDLSARRKRRAAASRIYGLLAQTRFEAHLNRTTLAAEFIRLAGENGRRIAFKDISGKDVSYRRALTGAFALGKYFSRFSEATLGLLLPNVTAAAVLFMGLQLDRKTPAFLNYAGGVAPLRHMLELGDIRIIVTSREFLRKINIPETAFGSRQLVFLEDVRAELGLAAKLAAAVKSRFAKLVYRPKPGEEQETAVILFTSGSEGRPKGVMLSHLNIISNINQCLARIDVNETDYLLNALPLFHSFGLTVGTLMPLWAGAKVFLYVSPLHFRVVPEIAYQENCTVLLGTNIFLNGYARKADPFDLFRVRYIYCGAEALLDRVFDTYAKKFGKRVLSGYGVTECSPVISMNNAIEHEYGSVGRILPGLEYRIEPMERMEGAAGLLHVKGPNVMKGYLKNPAANHKLHAEDGGWYNTGDIAEVTSDGFLRIAGRQKRFAKVSGEMVSLTAVEEALAYEFGERRETAILARPDETRGERIIAVSNAPGATLSDVRAVLRRKGFSDITHPRELHYLGRIPKLGNGKIDYPALSRELEKELTPAH